MMFWNVKYKYFQKKMTCNWRLLFLAPTLGTAFVHFSDSNLFRINRYGLMDKLESHERHESDFFELFATSNNPYEKLRIEGDEMKASISELIDPLIERRAECRSSQGYLGADKLRSEIDNVASKHLPLEYKFILTDISDNEGGVSPSFVEHATEDRSSDHDLIYIT